MRGAAATASRDVQYCPWLYRIATNVCLDVLRARGRRAVHLRSFAEVPWIQPYLDPLLDDRAEGRRARRCHRASRDDRAHVHRRPPGAAAAACGPDRQGRPRLAGRGDRGPARHERGRSQQRPATGRVTIKEHLPADRSDWKAPAPGTLSAEERHVLEQYIDFHEAATPPRPWPSQPRTSGSPCRPCPSSTTASTRSHRCSSGRSGLSATAIGGCCRRRSTACPPPAPTCAAGATRCTGRSSSTCSGA